MPEELVVLVDENDQMIGTMAKALVHGAETPLHRAFSAFIFRVSDGQLLLQQRSHTKQTWPLVWSNSCCGHPGVAESTLEAVRRRLRDELGLTPLRLEVASPYRYCFTRDGVMENEICPIVVGTVDTEPTINPDEVEAIRWVDWKEFVKETQDHPERYSEWCVEEVAILAGSSNLVELMPS